MIINPGPPRLTLADACALSIWDLPLPFPIQRRLWSSIRPAVRLGDVVAKLNGRPAIRVVERVGRVTEDAIRRALTEARVPRWLVDSIAPCEWRFRRASE